MSRRSDKKKQLIPAQAAGASPWAMEGELSLVPAPQEIRPPMGYTADFDPNPDAGDANKKAADKTELIKKSVMGIATSPGKQMLMTGLMLWMSGNSLQIFSIMMLGMAFWTPIQKLMTVGSAFARFRDSNVDLVMPKLLYILLNLAGVGLALWKCNSLGLLPTSPADWAQMRTVQPYREFSLS